MSEPALSVAFFDPDRGLHGTARAGLTLLFDGPAPTALADAAEIAAADGGWRASLPGRFDLRFEAVSEPADLGGATAAVCRVRGEVGGESTACLGTVTETREAPQWEALDALRAISAVFDERNALLALARRPRGAVAHGDEEASAFLLADGRVLVVEEARISTVYDGDGRQRNAGLELWIAGEDFPRRAAGSALSGASLELGPLYVHAAVFEWRMEGMVGAGAYEVTVRPDPAAA